MTTRILEYKDQFRHDMRMTYDDSAPARVRLLNQLGRERIVTRNVTVVTGVTRYGDRERNADRNAGGYTNTTRPLGPRASERVSPRQRLASSGPTAPTKSTLRARTVTQ